MKILDKGEFHFSKKLLEVLAKNENVRYRIMIPVQVFQDQYGTTDSGDFHEYWSCLMQNKENFENIAQRLLDNGRLDDNDVIRFRSADFGSGTS